MPDGDLNEVKSILFVTYHFPPEVGGIQTRISQYIEQLGLMGVKVTVLFFSARRKGPTKYQFKEARVLSLSGGTRHLLANLGHLINSIVIKRVRVVHVFTGASTFEGAFALLLGRVMRKPSVMSIFGREDLEIGRFSRKVLYFSANLATCITTNSTATMSLLPEKLRAKTKVLLGGAKLPSEELVNSNLVAKERDEQILYVGRLVKRKGVDDLLEAFLIVKRAYPKSKLVIVGDGPQKAELYQKSRVLKLDRLEFKGALFGQELEEQYAKSCLCVLPSKYVEGDSANEGLGLTLIEAAMYGTPIVGTRHGGIPEVVQDGVNGLLVPEGNPLELARAITRLLSDGNLRETLGENARKDAVSRFSWKAATQRLLASYSKE